MNTCFCSILTIHYYAICPIDHPSHDYPSHIRSCNRFFPPGNGLGNMPRPFSQQPTPTLFHSQNHILAAFHFICKKQYLLRKHRLRKRYCFLSSYQSAYASNSLSTPLLGSSSVKRASNSAWPIFSFSRRRAAHLCRTSICSWMISLAWA